MNKKLHFFPITIEALEEGGFLASCPVLQGCHVEGKTYAQAIDNIHDAIKVHIKARLSHGEIVPEVSVPQKTDLKITLPLPVSL